MDMDRNLPDIPQPPQEVDSRIKSPTRMRYEAEVLVLKNQNGDLDQIRQKLGLSRRKICQLLLVDPSAWTRWTQAGGEAPPHIYRALDWYLSIMEKDPEYRRLAHRFSDWMNREKDYEGRLASLEALQAAQKRRSPPTIQWFALFFAFLAGAALVLAIRS